MNEERVSNLAMALKEVSDSTEKSYNQYKIIVNEIADEIDEKTNELGSDIKSVKEAIEKQSSLTKSDNNVKWLKPFKNSFEKVQDTDFTPWNSTQLKNILETIKSQGILLSGGTGTGKSYLAENIGKFLLKEYTDANGNTVKNEYGYDYDEVYYAKFNVGKLSPNLVSWGTSITGNYELGIILQAAELAKLNPKAAYIVHLDEVTRSDFIGDIASLFDFLSNKGKSSVQLPDYTEDRGVIRYSDNLFIICTANSAISGGKRYETTPLKDPAFLDRFTRYEIVGILETRESLNKFKSISNNKLLNEVLEKLFNALEAMNDKNKADKIPSSIDKSRAISTRKMLKAKDIKEISIDNLVIDTTVENQLEKFSNEQKEKIYDALSIEGSLKEILSLSDGTLKDILTTSPANTDSDK